MSDRTYVGHFTEDQTTTLCGLAVTGIVWRSDHRADCKLCCTRWMRRGWEFPLPEIAEVD